jgi:hypothetical protein
MTDIAAWLEGLGLGKYAAAFADAGIDADILPDLSELNLEKLGLPLGPRKKLLRAIAGLGNADAAVPASLMPATPRDQADRRQLTMRCIS